MANKSQATYAAHLSLKMPSGNVGSKNRVLSESGVKVYKLGAFIEACNDFFLNEVINYVITDEEPARF